MLMSGTNDCAVATFNVELRWAFVNWDWSRDMY